jgi:hypothetical protein
MRIGSCTNFVSSVLQVPFLNLMANLQQRAGQVLVRVGGNTQDTAVLVPSTPDGHIIEKDLASVTNPVCCFPSPLLLETKRESYLISNY